MTVTPAYDDKDKVGLATDNTPSCIQLYGGGFFDLLNPDPAKVRLTDIVQSLSLLNRYTGHTDNDGYSVGQHSCHVADFVRREINPHWAYVVWGLMHDAAEAYTNDVSRPMKITLEDRAPGVLRSIEHNILEAIAVRFDLPWPVPPEIKEADNVLLATEKRDLNDRWSSSSWNGLPDPLPTQLVPWVPSRTRWEFNTRWNRYAQERVKEGPWQNLHGK